MRGSGQCFRFDGFRFDGSLVGSLRWLVVLSTMILLNTAQRKCVLWVGRCVVSGCLRLGAVVRVGGHCTLVLNIVCDLRVAAKLVVYRSFRTSLTCFGFLLKYWTLEAGWCYQTRGEVFVAKTGMSLALKYFGHRFNVAVSPHRIGEFLFPAGEMG